MLLCLGCLISPCDLSVHRDISPGFPTLTFTRFDLYARLVNTLQIDCRVGDDLRGIMLGDDLSPWHTLMSRRRHKPPVPNLKSLQLVLTARKVLIHVLCQWINALLSASFRLIEAYYCSVDNPGGCPDLCAGTVCDIGDGDHTISFASRTFFVSPCGNCYGCINCSQTEAIYVIFFSAVPQYWSSIMQNLRCLTSNISVLQINIFLIFS